MRTSEMNLSDEENTAIIDLEILELQEQMRILRNKRNVFQPISRLPTEVLCSIFLIVCQFSGEAELHPGYDDYYQKDIYHWTSSVAAVSQQWRSICLNFSPLWSTITTREAAQPWRFRMYLKRSKGSLLSIFLNYRRPVDQYMEDLHPHIQRLKVLRVAVTKETTLQQFNAVAVPDLQYLYLKNESDRCLLRTPPDFLSGGSPKLRTVELDQIGVDWTSHLFGHTLTTLKLHLDSQIGHSSPTTPAQFFDAMQRMPRLRRLSLIFSHDVFTDAMNLYAHVSTVAFYDMEDLELIGSMSMSTCTTIIKHFTLPISTSIFLKCRSNAPDSRYKKEFSNLLSSLDRAWLSNPLSSNTEILGCGADSPRIRSLGLSLFDGCIKIWPHNKNLAAQGSVVFEVAPLTMYINIQDEAFDEVLRALPLESLGSVCVGTAPLSAASWHAIAQLPLLTSLRIEESDITLFLGFILAQAELFPDKVSQFLPKLTYLTIGEVDFGLEEYTEDDAIEQFQPVSMNDFLMFLKIRSDAGVPLQNLRLMECWNISSSDVKKMKSFVGTVDWDGEENERHDSDLYDSDSDY